MASHIRISTQRTGHVARVTATGLLDAYTGMRLRDEIAAQLRRGVTDIELDVSEISFLNSGGLRILTDAADDLERLGGRLTLAQPSRAVVKILQITHLSARFAG